MRYEAKRDKTGQVVYDSTVEQTITGSASKGTTSTITVTAGIIYGDPRRDTEYKKIVCTKAVPTTKIKGIYGGTKGTVALKTGSATKLTGTASFAPATPFHKIKVKMAATKTTTQTPGLKMYAPAYVPIS